MRNILFFAGLSLVACGKSPMGTGDDTTGPDGNTIVDPAVAFEVKSTDFVLAKGAEVTKCFYFTTSNTDTVAIHKWTSLMAVGSHHMIMLLNPGGTQPADGTIDESCSIGNGSGGAQPVWTYASQTSGTLQTQELPADDGAGKPLAQNIAPHTKGYFQMHYLNSGDADVTVNVDLKAYALPAGTAYTQTDAYITYQYNINIGASATNVTVPGSCPVPPGAKFWQMSTHAHKQAIHMQVTDGSTMLFQTDSWEHPGVKEFAPQFYTFAGANLSWQCTYDNPGNQPISQGQSAQTNEMCMATGYYFPAAGPKFCVAFGPSQCQCL